MPADVSFGFNFENEDGPAVQAKRISSSSGHSQQGLRSPERNVGLGTGTGGLLARSCLTSVGVSLVDSRRGGRHSSRLGARSEVKREPALSARSADGLPLPPAALNNGPGLHGLWSALVLGDPGPVAAEELEAIRTHRWTFPSAQDLAARGQDFCAFVRCLLDLQRNVQLKEEGEPLDPRLARACRSFVSLQCRHGLAGEMYHLLTHLVSNSLVFHEWERFLRAAFEDPRANQEAFLVPHLEQVWGRFCRLRGTLECIFDVLNSRYAWRHRLPQVADLLQEHMRRRCFSSETVARNELFLQQAPRNEVLKQVQFAFGFV